MPALWERWQQLGHPRLLVVGDLMLDRYTIGDAERISPEAPVIVLQEAEEEVRPGGAANVAAMLRGLEAEVVLAGVIGNDHAGRTLLHWIQEAGIDSRGVLTLPERPTTTKHRFAGRSGQRPPHPLFRVDREVRCPLSVDVEQRLLEQVLAAMATCAAVLISDYSKGVCSLTLLSAVVQAARARGVPVLVDPSRGGNYARYADAFLVAPNRAAAELWAGHPLRTEAEILAAVVALRQQLRLEVAVITLDRDGLAFADGQERDIVPSRPRDVCDVTGAGDMVQAILGLGSAAGLPLRDCLALANVAAGLEVEQFGATPVARQQVATELLEGCTAQKFLDLDELARHADRLRHSGKTLVFTNGCFDLLHPGHVQMLQAAANLGDVLVVAVNSDAGVRRLKGPERPVLNEHDRAHMLAALTCVDHVLIFDDDTPHRLLGALRPDVLVKGGTTDQIVGREIVEAYGGQIMHTPIISELSTSNLIQRLRKPPPAFTPLVTQET